MIKVLHFVSTLSIGSGVMSVIMNYYRHIDRAKIQFDFLFFLSCGFTDKSYESEIKQLGGQIFLTKKPGDSIDSLRELYAFFKNHGKDYTWLHNHEVYLSFLLKPLANRNGIKHFIVHCHATKYSDRFMASIRNRLLCFPIRFLRCEYFSCSKAAGEFLYGKQAIKQGKVFIMKNAIEVERFSYNTKIRSYYRQEMNLNGCFVLGHIGRFAQQKNHVFLIRLFAEIADKIPQARLLMIGSGPGIREMERLVYSLGLEKKAIFLNERTDVENLLQAMDLFLLPSLYEGLPLSCLEAQASGLPCLVSTAISREVLLSDFTIRIPLSIEAWLAECLNQWANLLTTLESEDFSTRNQVCHGIPDIRYEADILSTFYISADN